MKKKNTLNVPVFPDWVKALTLSVLIGVLFLGIVSSGFTYIPESFFGKTALLLFVALFCAGIYGEYKKDYSVKNKDREKVKEKIKWFTEIAELGEDDDEELLKRWGTSEQMQWAQYSLAVLYADGEGIPCDYKEAVKWYTKAAEQGHEQAQYALGDMYLNGRGVSKNYKDAAKWFIIAAEQGLTGAQYQLGLMYRRGKGIPRDYKEAAKWLTKVAEHGKDDKEAAKQWPHKNAQYVLGLMYAKGEGVPQDDNEAVKWLTKAADQGLTNAQYELGKISYRGKGVPQDYKEAIKSWMKTVYYIVTRNVCFMSVLLWGGIFVILWLLLKWRR